MLDFGCSERGICSRKYMKVRLRSRLRFDNRYESSNGRSIRSSMRYICTKDCVRNFGCVRNIGFNHNFT